MKEGWGKGKYNNYYTKKAVESSVSLALSRKKMFFDHPADESKVTNRSIKDWAATIKETWLDDSFEDGKVRNRARVMVHNDYLLKLCKEVPEEVGVSIEGRGIGKKGKIDGKEGNIIEEVKWINAFQFVDYPGAADMGAVLVEKDNDNINNKSEEVRDMEIKTLAQLREQYPNLVSQLVDEVKNKDAREKEIKDLLESKTNLEVQVKEKTEEINEMKKETERLEKEIEERDKTIAKLNEQIVELEKKVDDCLLYTSPSPRDLSTSRMPSSA